MTNEQFKAECARIVASGFVDELKERTQKKLFERFCSITDEYPYEEVAQIKSDNSAVQRLCLYIQNAATE